MDLLTTCSRQHERLTPAEFLTLSPGQKADIKQTRIVAPVLGQKGDFGHIEVTYKTPRYVVDIGL